jgi:hypothetical protein
VQGRSWPGSRVLSKPEHADGSESLKKKKTGVQTDGALLCGSYLGFSCMPDWIPPEGNMAGE